MATLNLKAEMLRRMFLSGAKNLEVRKNYINELNVFPVPDGDTGTNMTLTILSAATEVSRLEDAGIEDLAKAISSGSLRGARGNSGVILSQLLRGFTKVIRDEKEPDVNCLVTAMEKAVETAYKAVMKPKEGTILTVARMMAEKAAQCRDELGSLEELFELVLSAGDEALAKTPELLPVLKEAGVVDSGGAGLMTILHGAVDAFNGLEIQLDFEAPPVEVRRVETPISTDEITFGYCTEFIVKLEKEFTDEDEEEMKDFLLSLGDSLVFVTGDGMVKVHVHTNHPGKAFEKGLEYGQLTRMKVDNMREEHEERLFKSTEVAAAREREKADQAAKEAAAVKKDVAFVAVTIGDGLADLFRQLGCDVIIEGGQTMNPSTEDMLDAIKTANAKDIFILPNNKNVVLAANQAADITETEDPETRIHVIPTRTVPQGISALISYVPEQTPEENAAGMAEAGSSVKSGEVTYSVRDTKIDGVSIRSGDIMGIGDAGILSVGSDVKTVVLQMLEKLIDEDSEIVSIYNGENFSDEETAALVEEAQERFPDVEIEQSYGGQPVYYCILSIE